MQQQITQQSSAAVAPEPARKVVRYYLIVLGVALALLIGSFFLPEPFRDELTWSKSPPLFNSSSFQPFLVILLPAIFIWPFINIPIITRYRYLEKNRRQAVENRLSGRPTITFPLPAIFILLPATVSVRVRRSWRATLIAGAIYTTLIGFVLLAFVSDWQFNIQSLAQRGEISGWTLLGSLFNALFYCLIIFPAITAFLFAPRQRLIATRDGLICYRWLRFSYIPWPEANLFAVIAEQHNTLIYELASSTSIIRWSSKPTWTYRDTFPAATVGIAPLGLIEAENSTEAYQWQIRQLTAMVAAGTGLPLYDLR
jgi:hypothetical protein